MADSDKGPPAPTSEVGSHGSRPEETRSSLEDHSATKLLSNMEALLSRMVSMSQMPSASTTVTQLLQFNPDDSDADIEGWCNVTEMIVQKKCLEGVELLMALTSALKGRAASCITRLNLNELTWPLVKQSLLAKFSKPKLPQDYFDDILRFQIGIKETASESALRLWNIIERIPKANMPEEVITGFVVSVLCQKDGVIRRELNAHLISNRSQLFRILGGISSKRRLESEMQELEVKRPRMSDTRFPGKCHWCGLSGHRQADCRKRRDAGSTAQADASNTSRLADRTPAVTCYVCGKQGHVATACPDRKTGGGAAVKEVNLCGQRTSRGILKSSSGGVWSLKNLSISVPRAVLSGEGQAAVLRCSYDLEGAALYSIRWYRAETEFYRYVPRELPPSMVFPLPGASVDLTQSDENQVRIVNLNRRLSGDYQCEVSADAPLFHTDIRSAPLTVVDPPFRAPRLTVSRGNYARGDVIRAHCTVDEAYPAPNITWILDEHKIAETIPEPVSELDFTERGASSQLEITVLETEQYRVGLTYTSASLARAYRDYGEEKKNRTAVRYAMVPPPSGQFELGCVSTILDIYARKSESVTIREDAPHPASVTGEDSSGAVASCSLFLLACACTYHLL